MTRGTDRVRRRRKGSHFPTTPLALVAFGVFAIAVGVAVPLRSLTVGLADVATGGVALTSVPLFTGLALCVGGMVALFYGLILLMFD